MKNTSFTRSQLHGLFAKFKALIMHHNLYKRRARGVKLHSHGINFETFKMGVDVMLAIPDSIALKIFNSQRQVDNMHEQAMRWDMYIKTLDLIAARSLQSKIELFMELMDENRTGAIEYEEIFNAGQQLLRKIFRRERYADGIDDLSHFLTRAIYRALDLPETHKIVRAQLLQKLGEESDRNKVEQNDLDFLFMICIAQSSELQGYDEEDEEDSAQSYAAEVKQTNRMMKLIERLNLDNEYRQD